MQQVIQIKYINVHLQIGMVDWREVCVLKPHVVKLKPEVDRGRLVYRAKGSTRRFSYAQINEGLVKKTCRIVEEVPD